MYKRQALRPVAHIRSPFTEKFGIPRQSGLVEEVSAQVVFEEGFRAPEAFRGMEGLSLIHIWFAAPSAWRPPPWAMP